MIAGCYTLALYCDVEGCKAGKINGTEYERGHRTGHQEFYAETGGECRRIARKVGWKIDLKAGTAVCPTCRVKLKAGEGQRG